MITGHSEVTQPATLAQVSSVLILLAMFLCHQGLLYAGDRQPLQQNSTCETAAPFCTGTLYLYPAGVNCLKGQTGPDYGCLITCPNPAWYFLKIAKPGTIVITMGSKPARDIDFCCWGPFTYPDCCSYLTAGKIVSCSFSPSAFETCTIPKARTGEFYMLILTNFSNQPCNIKFQQTGGNATTDCSILTSNPNDRNAWAGKDRDSGQTNSSNSVKGEKTTDNRLFEKASIYAGEFRASDLANGQCIKGTIISTTDKDTLVLDPNRFDLTVTHNYPTLFRKVTVSISGTAVILCPQKRGYWCDCFLPDTLVLTIVATPRHNLHYQGFSQPVKIKIIRDSTWWTRCKWVIFNILGIIIFCIYLYFINRKPRFKKGSGINTEYSTASLRHPIKGFMKLRKSGLSGWFNRWFNPFTAESVNLAFAQPGRSFRFMATRSSYRVNIPKGNFDTKNMICPNFDEEDKLKTFELSDGDSIIIQKVANIPNAVFRISYDRRAGVRDDIQTVRFFSGLLMVAALLIMVFFIVSLITVSF
ncbi:MAG: hypothetical protein NT040_10580 [Bacteroidetes bacterium]|nr:hypothetical protein [Bacteroidota bacterium]